MERRREDAEEGLGERELSVWLLADPVATATGLVRGEASGDMGPAEEVAFRHGKAASGDPSSGAGLWLLLSAAPSRLRGRGTPELGRDENSSRRGRQGLPQAKPS